MAPTASRQSPDIQRKSLGMGFEARNGVLLEVVWDYHFDPQTNVIDVYMSRLRQKIDKGSDRPLLHTVRGAGYTQREDP